MQHHGLWVSDVFGGLRERLGPCVGSASWRDWLLSEKQATVRTKASMGWLGQEVTSGQDIVGDCGKRHPGRDWISCSLVAGGRAGVLEGRGHWRPENLAHLVKRLSQGPRPREGETAELQGGVGVREAWAA